MCKKEDSLITIANSDHKTKKELYEKLGDGACYLKNYPKAIEYYQKMLEEAKLNGESGKDLSPCYVSLAQTYSDNKQYDSALNYFGKELQLCENNLKESVNTLYSIADTMELSGRSIEDVKNIYLKIRTMCQNDGNKQLEGVSLKRYGVFLRNHNQVEDALKVEKELKCFGFMHIDNSEESEASDDNTAPNIGDDIDTDDITGT